MASSIASCQDELRDFAGEAGGEGDQALVVLLQQLFIHPRLVVEAFQVGFGGQLDQVLVAGLVLGQQDQVVVVFIAGVAAEVAARGDIDLAADDGLDAGLSGCLVELDDAVHHAVVGDGQAVHAQLFGPCHQLRDAAHAVEQAVFGVDMEVGEHFSPGFGSR